MFVCYLSNSKKLKKLFSSDKYKETSSFYQKTLEENKKNVTYPKRFKANKKAVSLDRKLLLFVEEHGTEKKIIKQQEYLVEETFYVYGQKRRYNVEQLLEKVFLLYVKDFTTVKTFKNKIVLESGEDLECILTKNISECKRLYEFLKNAVHSKKIYSFLFVGKVPEKPREIKIDLIKRLVKLTGLSHFQFKRKSTRH
jgi:hypothetical protein